MKSRTLPHFRLSAVLSKCSSGVLIVGSGECVLGFLSSSGSQDRLPDRRGTPVQRHWHRSQYDYSKCCEWMSEYYSGCGGDRACPTSNSHRSGSMLYTSADAVFPCDKATTFMLMDVWCGVWSVERGACNGVVSRLYGGLVMATHITATNGSHKRW